jgi:hypothetical protein
VPGGFGFPLGAAAGVLLTLTTVAAGATGHPQWSVAALAVVVTGAAVVTTPGATAGTAVVCWCLVSGFVVGRQGDLTFSGASLLAAAVLGATAVGAVAVVTAVRVARRWRRTEPSAVVERPRLGLGGMVEN